MDYKVTDTELTGVANHIRTKGGTSAPLEWPTGYENAIDALPDQAVLVTKTITENGTYSASSDNADGYSQVVVNVSGGGAYPRIDFISNYSLNALLSIYEITTEAVLE